MASLSISDSSSSSVYLPDMDFLAHASRYPTLMFPLGFLRDGSPSHLITLAGGYPTRVS